MDGNISKCCKFKMAGGHPKAHGNDPNTNGREILEWARRWTGWEASSTVRGDR